MKKRIACGLVALMLCASLSACSTPGAKTVSDLLDKNSSADASSSAPKTESEKPAEDDKKDDTVKYEKPTLSATGYESKYFNLKFTAPADYVMATDEEILTVAEQSGATINDDGTIDYENTPVLFEMISMHTSGAPNVTVIAEKLALENLTIEQYADVAKKQLSGSGMTAVDDGKTTEVTLGGEKFLRMQASGSTEAGAVMQDVHMRKVGPYVLLVSVTYMQEAAAMNEALLSGFSKLA